MHYNDSCRFTEILKEGEKNAMVYVAGACAHAVVNTFTPANNPKICAGLFKGAPSTTSHQLIDLRNWSGTFINPSALFQDMLNLASQVFLQFLDSKLDHHPFKDTTVAVLLEITKRKIKSHDFYFKCDYTDLCNDWCLR